MKHREFLEYIEKMKKIQSTLLEYIDKDDDDEENYQNLIQLFKDQRISSNVHDLKTIIYILVRISNSHHRNSNFFHEKIDKIIQIFKSDIQKYFSNSEIFKFFKKSKRLLLFLIEENIIKIDKTIVLEMMSGKMEKYKYPEYFAKEIKPFIDDDIIKKYNEMQEEKKKDITITFLFEDQDYDLIKEIFKEMPDDFEAKRRKGENDDIVIEMIRNDSIEEFIIYVNKTCCSLNNCIKPSIYDTNSFLLAHKEISLIEYAAFYGSSQIFKYLFKNKAEIHLTLWLYAIHGEDPEIFSILEEDRFDFLDNGTLLIYRECIKCHHNDVLNYLRNLHEYDLDNIDYDLNFKNNVVYYSFHYYNFLEFPKELNNAFVFYYACKYDYFAIVKHLINSSMIDINAKFILLLYTQIQF